MDNRDDELKRRNRRLKAWIARQQLRVKRRFPAGVRTLLGLALIVGGLLGALPILGFWMIPLGIVFISTDVGPMFSLFDRIFGAGREGGD